MVIQGDGRPGMPLDYGESLEAYVNPAQRQAEPEKDTDFTNSRGDVVRPQHGQHDGKSPGCCQGVEASRQALDSCGHRRSRLRIVDFHEHSAMPLGVTECIAVAWETAGATERR